MARLTSPGGGYLFHQEGHRLALDSSYPKWLVNTLSCEHLAHEEEENPALSSCGCTSLLRVRREIPLGKDNRHQRYSRVNSGTECKGPRTCALPSRLTPRDGYCTCSTTLVCLHYQLKNAGLNTKVDFMDSVQEKGLGAHFLALLIYEKGDPTYEKGNPTDEKRNEPLTFLINGSPKLRALFSVVHQTSFVEAGKLLVVEDIPLCTKFYEDGHRAAWTHCETLQSKLHHKQRQSLINDFNNKTSTLQVLIIMADVAANELNLQKAAKLVISMVLAERANPRMQAENRVLRKDQLEI